VLADNNTVLAGNTVFAANTVLASNNGSVRNNGSAGNSVFAGNSMVTPDAPVLSLVPTFCSVLLTTKLDAGYNTDLRLAPPGTGQVDPGNVE
jgi:hypothetical protein